MKIGIDMDNTICSTIEKIKECLKELVKQNLIEISDETDEIFIVDWGSYNCFKFDYGIRV